MDYRTRQRAPPSNSNHHSTSAPLVVNSNISTSNNNTTSKKQSTNNPNSSAPRSAAGSNQTSTTNESNTINKKKLITKVPITTTGTSSSSENEDLLQPNPMSSLQSLSQQTISSNSVSSQQVMLANHHHQNINSSQQRLLLSHQQYQQQMNSQQQRQTMMQQQQQQQRLQQQQATRGQHHHQNLANTQLAPNTLISAPNNTNNKSNSYGSPKHNNNNMKNNINNSATSSADNMTTTSSSDHTLDDLQQLAHNHHHHGHYNQHHHRNQKQQHQANGNPNRKQSTSTGTRYSYASEDPLSPARLALTSGHSTSHHHLDHIDQNTGSRFLLGVLFTLAEILLFAVLLLWLYWAFQHDDGLAWQSDRKQQFNTHAALMILGFIFFNGQAMLIYRSFQCCSKIYTKILHTIIFVMATSAISFGLILAYTAQENVGANNKPIMHYYSLHSWIGLSSIALFGLQFVFGFVSFLVLLCCDQATSSFRAALLPIHRTFGLIIFSLAISTCLTGLLQTARSRLSSKLGKIDYHELAEAGIVINVIGACLICLAILMPYIIRNLDIKRPVKPIRAEIDRRLRLSQLDMGL